MLRTLTQVLSALADAPVLACLVGTRGATVVWHDTPVAATALVGSGSSDDTVQVGDTWAPLPLGANLVQLDYEWPQQAALVIPAQRIARIASDGSLHIETSNPAELAQAVSRIQRPLTPLAQARLCEPVQPCWGEDLHRERVTSIKHLIAAGDCYQINLAVPFRARLHAQPHADLAAFCALVAGSPAPFAACFRSPGRPTIVSHSPECFLGLRGQQVQSVPIKGTRARRPGTESATRAELLAHPKDNAELAMIVDLVRNDLGRIAVAGSVRVVDPALVIDLDYVHHRAARIVCQRRSELLACIQAAFPAGSITGAPKIRAMQIIRDLEGAARGPAYGCFGWLGADAGDLAVAIRTASIDGDAITFHAGGGIVADSLADEEWREVLAKASGFTRALGTR